MMTTGRPHDNHKPLNFQVTATPLTDQKETDHNEKLPLKSNTSDSKFAKHPTPRAQKTATNKAAPVNNQLAGTTQPSQAKQSKQRHDDHRATTR